MEPMTKATAREYLRLWADGKGITRDIAAHIEDNRNSPHETLLDCCLRLANLTFDWRAIERIEDRNRHLWLLLDATA